MAVNWEARAKQLATELAIANSEIAKLRDQGQSVHARRVDRAWQDALALANLHIAYIETTRRNAEKFAGMTNNRWENARALLKLARLHNGRRWLAHDLATIEERLSAAKEIAIAEPAAFRARLPAHARYGPKVERKA